jgi:hypothetical protein
MPLDGDGRTRIAIAFEKEQLHCFDIPPGAAVELPLMWKWAAAQAARPLGKDCHPPRHDGDATSGAIRWSEINSASPG